MRCRRARCVRGALGAVASPSRLTGQGRRNWRGSEGGSGTPSPVRLGCGGGSGAGRGVNRGKPSRRPNERLESAGERRSSGCAGKRGKGRAEDDGGVVGPGETGTHISSDYFWQADDGRRAAGWFCSPCGGRLAGLEVCSSNGTGPVSSLPAPGRVQPLAAAQGEGPSAAADGARVLAFHLTVGESRVS